MRIFPRQVEAFRAVMLTGSMTGAAEHMHISQPAISRLIRDLEAEVAMNLFERKGSRLLPRESALLLFREVERFYVGLDQIGRAAYDIRLMKGGVLRIGAVSSLNGICVQQVMRDFMRSFPQVTLIFDTESTDRIVDLVALRHYDLGLVFGHEGRAGLPSETIAETEAIAVMAADHPLAERDAIGVGDLADQRLLIPGRRAPLRLRLDRVMARAEIPLSAPFEASIANCCQLAAQGLGVAIVDPLTAAEHGSKLAIRRFLPKIAMDYEIVLPPQAPASILVEAFCDAVKQAALDRLSAVPVN